MTIPEAFALAFTAGIGTFALLLALRTLWHWASNKAARHIEQIIANAIGTTQLGEDHRDLDAEYHALILETQTTDE